MTNESEAFSRVLIDDELRYSGWNLLDSAQVKYEVHGQAGRADYVLLDSHGPLCVLEAKNPDKNPYDAKEQARAYADELNAPFVILSNGTHHYLWNLQKADSEDAYRIERFPSPKDLSDIKLKNLTPAAPLMSEVVGHDYLKLYNPEISLRKYQINALDTLANQFDTKGKN